MKKLLLVSILVVLVFSLTGCKSKSEKQVISFDGVKISYDAQGKGEPELVFVHGWSCDKEFWKYQVPYFSKKHKVVTIDMGGHGKSGKSREQWTVEAYGKDVAMVIEKLDLKKVILVGHSMGGAVIAEAAYQRPENIIGVAGADTFHDFERGYNSNLIRQTVEEMKADFVGKTTGFINLMFSNSTNTELKDWIINKVIMSDPNVAINVIENLSDYDIKMAVSNISVPVYSINSDLWPTEVEGNKKYAKTYEIKMMPGLGHFVMLEDPNGFNKLLDEVISEVAI